MVLLNPNVITSFRILVMLVGSLFILFPATFFLGVGWILLGSISDRLDGYIARKYQLGSEFGQVYDQAADKISAVFVMAAMVYLRVLPLWLMAAIIVRDYAMVLFRDYSLLKLKKVLAANWFGKRKSEVNAACALLLLLLWKFGWAFDQTKWFFYVVLLVVNYGSLVSYLGLWSKKS